MSAYLLGQITSVFNGKTPSVSEQRSDGHPVLKIRDVDDSGVFLGACASFVDHAFARKHKEKLLQAGDILILNAAHNADYVASKTFFAKKDVENILPTGEWLVVRSDNKCVDSKFLHFWLTSSNTKARLKELVKGIHLYPKDVAGLSIDLPPLSKQKIIASILDKADAIRQKRQQAITLLDDLLRATFLDMFGDVEAEKWGMSNVQSMALSEKGAIRTGPFGSQLLHSEFVNEGIAVLGIDNAVKNRFVWGQARYITPEKYSQLRRYTVKPGDVLITIMGTCGRCAVVPSDCPTAINTKHLCCITLDWKKCLPSFLHAYFLIHPIARKYLQQKAKGAIMDGLNMGIIQDLPVPEVPLSLQKNFDSVSQKVLQLKAAAEQRLADETMLFESLVQSAFNGAL